MEMVIKIDKQGRVVLPKEIREKYQFNQDSELMLISQEDGIFIKPKKARRSLASIFQKATTFDPEKVVALDIANFDENEV